MQVLQVAISLGRLIISCTKSFIYLASLALKLKLFLCQIKDLPLVLQENKLQDNFLARIDQIFQENYLAVHFLQE